MMRGGGEKVGLFQCKYFDPEVAMPLTFLMGNVQHLNRMITSYIYGRNDPNGVDARAERAYVAQGRPKSKRRAEILATLGKWKKYFDPEVGR